VRLLCLVLVVGCYAPTYAPGGSCTTTCPGDLVCVDSVCVVPGTVVDHDAAVQIDAPGGEVTIDAPMIDAPPPDPTLIAHWKFDDNPANGTVLDSTGNGHNGACVATACPTLVTGVDGGAYRFDPAVPQFIVVPDSTAFRGVFTIAAWMYTDNTTKQIAVMSKPVGTSSGNSWQLEDLTDDTVSFSGGSVHSLSSPMVVPQMTWAHLAGTWDGTTKRLYVNGVMVASSTSQISYDTQDVFLGADENSGALALPFDGELDDLRVYNRVLTAQELAALAQ